MAINLGFESLGITTNKRTDSNPVMNELEILHNLSMISIQMEHITADFSNIDRVLDMTHHLCEINKVIKTNKGDKSLEHLYGSFAMKAATEGFKESVSNAWEAIKKFFKELFEKIKNLFLSKETIAKNAIKKVDDIVKNIKSKSIDKEKASGITISGIDPDYDEYARKGINNIFSEFNKNIEYLIGAISGKVSISEDNSKECQKRNSDSRQALNRLSDVWKSDLNNKHDINIGEYSNAKLFSDIEMSKESLTSILKEHDNAMKLIQKTNSDVKELKDQSQITAASLLKDTAKVYISYLNTVFNNEMTYLRRLTAIAEKVPTK